MDYTSLLSGSTGSLGFGGGVGGSGGAGYGNASSSATSGPITSGDITPRIGNISSGGVMLTPTINVAFPNASLGTEDDINPPLLSKFPKGIILVMLGLIGVVIIVRLFK